MQLSSVHFHPYGHLSFCDFVTSAASYSSDTIAALTAILGAVHVGVFDFHALSGGT
jgi:hypothetical protein